jgi:hypothetical protein
MWYSEVWMDTLKSYQPAIMENTPKGLLVAASAISDYKASFENVAPISRLVQKLVTCWDQWKRYKAADMMGKNVANRLVKAALMNQVYGGTENLKKDNYDLYDWVRYLRKFM